MAVAELITVEPTVPGCEVRRTEVHLRTPRFLLKAPLGAADHRPLGKLGGE